MLPHVASDVLSFAVCRVLIQHPSLAQRQNRCLSVLSCLWLDFESKTLRDKRDVCLVLTQSKRHTWTQSQRHSLTQSQRHTRQTRLSCLVEIRLWLKDKADVVCLRCLTESVLSLTLSQRHSKTRQMSVLSLTVSQRHSKTKQMSVFIWQDRQDSRVFDSELKTLQDTTDICLVFESHTDLASYSQTRQTSVFWLSSSILDSQSLTKVSVLCWTLSHRHCKKRQMSVFCLVVGTVPLDMVCSTGLR